MQTKTNKNIECSYIKLKPPRNSCDGRICGTKEGFHEACLEFLASLSLTPTVVAVSLANDRLTDCTQPLGSNSSWVGEPPIIRGY
jgi:hypothetical protein